jgi:L-threonylcarbamoyladenylate synthase
MKNIYLNIFKANFNNLKKAKKNIDNNNIIGIPTETVYGLAGNAYSEKSVKKIFSLKKRPTFNPLIVHYKNIHDLKKDAIFNKYFIKLYKAFCPGPITFILNKKISSKISKLASAGKKTIAVRVPQHIVARNLLKILKIPLAAPSANVSSRLSPTCSSDVADEFGNKIKFILDGGACKIGLESTIIDLTNKPTILRQGAITVDEIQKILKIKIIIKKKTKSINAPGQLNWHYYPGIPVFINKMLPRKGGAFIAFGKNYKDAKNCFNLSKDSDLKEAANNLYRTMRKIKKKGYSSIAVCKIPNYGLGCAINERLKKASYKWKR